MCVPEGALGLEVEEKGKMEFVSKDNKCVKHETAGWRQDCQSTIHAAGKRKLQRTQFGKARKQILGALKERSMGGRHGSPL